MQSTQRPSTGQSAKNKKLQNVQLQMGHLYCTLFPKIKNHWGGGSRKMIRAREVEGYKEIMFSRHTHKRAVAQVNLQYLREDA